MQGKHELTSAYVALIDQIRTLLARDGLCNNTYLFKHMKHSLALPLYIFAEERRVAAISSDQQQIAQAIEESGLAHVNNNREVVIIEYPTVKISTRVPQIFAELQRVLKEKQIRYSFSERLEKDWVNLTIYSQDTEFLEQLVVSLSKQVDFQRVSLYEDIRAGTARIRKLKQEQQKNNNGNYTGKTTYSLDKPPQIFIRRAVPSDDEEDDRPRGKNSGGKKKYKEVSKEVVNAPKFSNDDFPTLT